MEKSEIMYCLYGPKNRPRFGLISHYRKDVEKKWLKIWNNSDWKEWYNAGWRIKKVKVTVKQT